MEPTLSPLNAWETFYVIIGSSGAALTGLQFVVLTLVAQTPGLGGKQEINAFGTPTVVHFCAALLISAILTAPWHRLHNTSLAIGLCGVLGMLYVAIIIRRARGTREYTPVFEDWLWHTVLPLVAYAALLASALLLHRYPAPVLFLVAGAALLLLFIGIHNAWDTVTYIVVDRLPHDK